MLSLVLAKAISTQGSVIKKLVLAKALLLLSFTAFCAVGPPTPFQSVLWEEHPPAYYTQHAEEWKAYVSNPCAEENAWVHYYKFAQYSNRFDNGNYDLKSIEKEAEAASIPADGFALPYLKFANNNDPNTRYEQLLIAHKAQPDNPKPYTGLIAHYTLTNQIAKRDNILNKLQHIRPLPKGLLEYNYNQLESTAANAILLTNGDADTFPSWVLQTVFKHRTDVAVINWTLLWYAPTYRAQVAAELGVDIEAIENPTTMMDALHKAGRPLYMAMTVDLNQFGDHRKDWLFVTGLAMRYERPGFKNLAFAKTAYNTKWRLDHLRNPLANNAEQAVTDQLNRNYLPTLLELREFYGNDEAKVLEINSLITTIAQRANVENILSRITNGQAKTPPRLASTYVDFLWKRKKIPTAKDIFKGLVLVPAGLSKRVEDPLAENELVKKMIQDGESIEVRLDANIYMMSSEVSNGDYYHFVQDILLQKKNSYLDTIVAGKVDWATELFGEQPHQKMGFIFEESMLPVVNLSHRAAELYAQWLSEVYNDDPKRRDGRKVRFRLPTEEELIYAAMGGTNYAPYPWGGYYSNKRGCLLGNFRTWDMPEEERAKLEAIRESDPKNIDCKLDFMPLAPIASYFPNDYGLYNMLGNAAEMIDVEGITLGGSWLDTPQESVIGRSIQRPAPHPSTGFRLVAEFYD